MFTDRQIGQYPAGAEVGLLDDFGRITCRLAIQVCIGRSPSGRARHRTFSIKNIAPDADPSALAAVVRAIAPVLAYPITRVTLVTKRICALFGARGETTRAAGLEPEPEKSSAGSFKRDQAAEKFRPPVPAWSIFGSFRARVSFLLERYPFNPLDPSYNCPAITG
ncbi:MAG: hypothetical protein LBL51_06215 [Synergistaceae bacterium]|nr:hypothetical protein [Synergistaceae bacterium]